MTSQYVKCDAPGCAAVVDRYPPEHPRSRTHGDGTFGKMGGREARAYAMAIGWTLIDDCDLCPIHSRGTTIALGGPVPAPRGIKDGETYWVDGEQYTCRKPENTK